MSKSMFKHSCGWDLNARILRLHNDYYETGLANKSETTRDATLRLEQIVREEISQDHDLVWC